MGSEMILVSTNVQTGGHESCVRGEERKQNVCEISIGIHSLIRNRTKGRDNRSAAIKNARYFFINFPVTEVLSGINICTW